MGYHFLLQGIFQTQGSKLHLLYPQHWQVDSLPTELSGKSALCCILYFPSGASGKEPACQCRRHKRHRFHLWVGTIPWRRKWQPTPVFLPRKSYGHRNLVGYSPSGHKESDMTERLHFTSLQKLSRRINGWRITKKIIKKEKLDLPDIKMINKTIVMKTW